MPTTQSSLIEKGNKIRNKRTGKVLECYNIISVFIGMTNKFIRFEYSFFTQEKSFKSFKEIKLRQMLNTTWELIQ